MLATGLSTFVFFAVYLYKGLIAATFCGCIATFIGIAFEFFKKRKVSPSSLMSTFALIIALIMTLLSIKTQNINFIKMKLTLISITTSLVFLCSKIFFKTNLVRLLLSEKINMNDRGWMQCLYNTIGFFTFLGILNEIVWRNFSESSWVNFKVFGTMALSCIFAIIQSKTISKFSKKESIEHKELSKTIH